LEQLFPEATYNADVSFILLLLFHSMPLHYSLLALVAAICSDLTPCFTVCSGSTHTTAVGSMRLNQTMELTNATPLLSKQSYSGKISLALRIGQSAKKSRKRQEGGGVEVMKYLEGEACTSLPLPPSSCHATTSFLCQMYII
jgi:hypothetical protein